MELKTSMFLFLFVVIITINGSKSQDEETTTSVPELIEIEPVDVSEPTPTSSKAPPVCESNLEASSGIFISKNFPDPYDDNIDCVWNIKVDEGEKIKLTFHLFNVEQNNYCQYDWVKVHDSNGTVIKHICGYLEQDLIIYSSGNNMTVQFHTDSAVQSAGFLASWESIDEDINTDKLTEVSEQGYVLSFPQTFTVNSETEQDQLCLQMLNLQSDGKVTLSLFEGKNLISGESSAAKVVDVQAGDEDIHCYHMKLPKGFDKRYAIVGIKGDINGYKLYSFKSVRALKAKPLVLIQTDKFDYRPKQNVNIRMLLMNEDLKPSKTIQKVDEIWIEDPSGSRLHQWKDIELTQGLAQVTPYKLSDEATLGKWTIKASFSQSDDVPPTINEISFEVNENNLPSFEVTIEAPKFVLKDSEGESLKVCAKYTHGAKVKGQANITISVNHNAGSIWRPISRPVTLLNTALPLENGCSEIEFNATMISQLFNNKYRSSPEVFAVVKEEGTGEKQNATYKGIEVKDVAFEIDAGTSPEEYIISGFPYVGHFQVRDHSGERLKNVKFDVCSRLYTSLEKMKDFVTSTSHQFYNYNEEQFFALSKRLATIRFKETCMEATSDDNGKLSLAISFANIQVPENITKLSLHIAAKDYQANETTGMRQPTLTHEISLTHSNASSAITIQAANDKLSCGSNEVTVFISAPAETSIELTHFIASGGVMLASESTSVEIGNVDAREKFVGNAIEVPFEVDPESRTESERIILKEYKLKVNRPLPSESSIGLEEFKLLAYVRDAKSGETLTADQDFSLDKCNSVDTSINFSEESVRPGSPIKVNISGPANGYCGYSIVDKSVTLVPNPNKITLDKLSELKKQIIKKKIVSDNVRGENCQDARLLYKAFQKLGLFVLSDKLQFGTGCDTLVDVTGQERNRDNDYDDYYHSPPVALAAEASFDLAEDEIDFRQEARPVAFSANSNRIASNKVQQKFGSQAAPVDEEIEAPTIEIRNYFPETWLFDLINLDANGKSQIDLNAPDTVTTWIGDAFCTSDQTGVVIADESSFVVDQDFFVDLKMPFSIKRGEVFPINVTAFNKLNQKSLPLKLKVLDSDEIKLGGEEFEICVDAQDSQTQSFKIKAKELQEVNITVQAKIESFKGCDLGNGNAEGITDKVQKPIQVKPEGFPIEKVTSEFLCRKTADEDETVVDLGQVELPDEDNLVEGSARAFITVSGDIMAPTMKNLDKLVKQPYGCGEQNMISMVPNIYVAKYIEGTNQNQPEIMAAAKKYMKSGYERQESRYRHRDGSYSVWGPRDEEAKGSVWLTAFVIKAFTQASQFIDIDSRDLRKSQEWLNRKQDRDTGCFKIEGFVIHSELAKDSDVALTASVLISMMEYNDERKRGQFAKEIDMGYRCLENALKNNTNTYAKTLATYAFALKEDHFKRSSELLDELIESAHTDQPGKLFWTSKPESDGKIISSEDVEVTAYNVLSMIKHDKLSQALSAIKWLAGQRNAYGGFKSTQDTMIALQAMAEYSLAFEKSDNDLNLDVNAGDDKFEYEINEENELLLQSEKLTLNPEQLPKVSAKVSGKGCFMVQNILRYNVKQSPDQSSFELKVTQNQDNEVEVCAKYTGSAEKTNMVVTEIEMLSGFVPQDSSLKDLKGVKKVEFDEKTETLALYFNEMPKEELCLKFNVKEKVQIKDRKPAVAKVYDYYNQKDIVSIEYNVS